MPQLKVRRGRRFTCLGLGLPFLSILVLAACDTATELQQNATKAMQSLGDLSGLASNEQETSSLPNIGGSALSACTSPSDRKWVSKTQEDLAYLGYKPGPATGDLTPQTEQALRDYLWHHGYLKWNIAGTSGQCNLTAVGYTELTSGVPSLTSYVNRYKSRKLKGNPADVAATGYANRGNPPPSFKI